jgi:hypothetical protein
VGSPLVLLYADAQSKPRIVHIVLVIPAAMHGSILTAELILTKSYHATQSPTHAL